MTPPAPRRPPPPDAPERAAVLNDLDTNLLVEAGAGSGKTTALVGRILNLVGTGTTTIDRIAAVTFTRKAAGELRHRLQHDLESRIREGEDAERTARFRAALDDLDRAFMGTIHAFCARLLRERPLEARLDPGFAELTAPEERALARRFWDDWVEEAIRRDSDEIREVQAVGLGPSRVLDLFRALGEAGEVEMPLDGPPLPSVEEVEELAAKVESILDDALPRMTEVPGKGWESLQEKLRYGDYLRRVADLREPEVLFRLVDRLCRAREAKTTFNRWIGPAGETPKGEVREILDRLDALFRETPPGEAMRPGRAALSAWRAGRYRPVVRLARRAADDFAEFRRRNGLLTFHDLLALTVRLLRSAPAARRALGERYRYLLVDEFQDTDPLQTELVFLLATEPVGEGEPPAPFWPEALPRPGALFVVGDPKQSIYRFRRADIALYERVKRRFEGFGRVIRLTANFRSGPSLEALVEGVFSPNAAGRFPAEADEAQAAHAPLQVYRSEPGPKEGVFHYRVPEEACGRRDEVQGWDSSALAHWIAERVRSGDRAPGDFLILTRKKKGLDRYARELEARGLPVVVSGSGVGIEDELRELLIVLEALVDPGDPVRTVAALEGLFFGVDPADLREHHREGGRFDFRVRRNHGEGRVGQALATLDGWWRRAGARPADEVVGEICASIGLLPWAASGDLGSLRAGALAFTLDLIRSATVSSDASLAGALDALRTVLDDEDTEVEAPLEPARSGAVRVMNLHKAKGLQAKVVVLADPSGRPWSGRSFIVTRDAGGRALGWTRVTEGFGFRRTILAEPEGWDALAEREGEFERAEEDRLLYVAVTRAEEELVVGLREKKPTESPWGRLDSWVREHGTALDLLPAERPERTPLRVDPAEVAAEVERMRADRRDASRPRYRIETVTRLVRPEEGEADFHTLADSTGVGGAGWGSAVHATLEAALGNVDPAALRLTARTALLEQDRPVRGGEPIELDLLLELVDRLRRTRLWRRAEAADLRLVEHPFMWRRDEETIVEGVIDLAFRESAGWVLVDWKTAATREAFEQRRPAYEAQIALYAEAWASITGETVAETRVHHIGSEEGAASSTSAPEASGG